MQADTLNARAAVREHARKTIIALRAYGVTVNQMRNRSILELDEMHRECIERSMRAPSGR